MSFAVQAPPGVAEPAITEVQHADELLQICSAIGIRLDPSSGHVYTKGIECRGLFFFFFFFFFFCHLLIVFLRCICLNRRISLFIWALEVLNDLLRGIRRDGRHSTQSFIRQLGVFGILEKVGVFFLFFFFFVFLFFPPFFPSSSFFAPTSLKSTYYDIFRLGFAPASD